MRGDIIEAKRQPVFDMMTIVKRKLTRSHDEAIVRRLRRDSAFAAEYLKTTLEDEGDPRVLLIVLRHLVQAEGIAKVAKAAGVERESLYRALAARQSAPFDVDCCHKSDRLEAYGRSCVGNVPSVSSFPRNSRLSKRDERDGVACVLGSERR